MPNRLLNSGIEGLVKGLIVSDSAAVSIHRSRVTNMQRISPSMIDIAFAARNYPCCPVYNALESQKRSPLVFVETVLITAVSIPSAAAARL